MPTRQLWIKCINPNVFTHARLSQICTNQNNWHLNIRGNPSVMHSYIGSAGLYQCSGSIAFQGRLNNSGPASVTAPSTNNLSHSVLWEFVLKIEIRRKVARQLGE